MPLYQLLKDMERTLAMLSAIYGIVFLFSLILFDWNSKNSEETLEKNFVLHICIHLMLLIYVLYGSYLRFKSQYKILGIKLYK
jgi:hypothetical protein